MAKTKTTDTKTLELIKEVNRQKKEISSAEKPQYVTNCNFSYSENGSSITNIHVEINVGNLTRIIGFLMGMETNYYSAAIELGVDPGPFTWQGFLVKDWTNDVRQRLNKVQVAAKRKKLEVLETRLNSIISPEMRAQMELEAITEELGK